MGKDRVRQSQGRPRKTGSHRPGLLPEAEPLIKHVTQLLKSTEYRGRVGTLEGTSYVSKELYRPAADCRTITLSLADFDLVFRRRSKTALRVTRDRLRLESEPVTDCGEGDAKEISNGVSCQAVFGLPGSPTHEAHRRQSSERWKNPFSGFRVQS